MTALALQQIQRDLDIQQRAGGLQPARIREYATAMREGEHFPPVIVYHDGTNYWLADGFHRCAAAREASSADIAVEICQGTRRDALLYAVGANAAHGLRRTNADKHKAVLTLLHDEEWREWSDHEIARRVHVTQPFVSKLRRAMSSGEAMTLRKSADGRVIETGNIGRNSPMKQLDRAWEKTPDPDRHMWLEQHRTEIQPFFEGGTRGKDAEGQKIPRKKRWLFR